MLHSVLVKAEFLEVPSPNHYSAAQVCPAVKITLGLEERFHKPLLKDLKNELYKTDIVLVKGGQALMKDIHI